MTAVGPDDDPGFLRPPTDLRLAAAALGSWAAAAWGYSRDPTVLRTAVVATAVILLIAVVVLVRRRAGAGFLVVVAMVLLVLLSCWAAAGLQRSGSVADWADARARVTVSGEVRSDPRPMSAGFGGEPRIAVDLLVRRAESRETSVAAATRVVVFTTAIQWGAAGTPPPGTTVELSGRLLAADEGDVPLLVADAPPQVLAPTGRVGRTAETWRTALRTACATLPADARGLLPGLVVGDTSELPPDLKEAMTGVGLSHLTAVSGSNTSLVIGAVVLLASFLGFGRRARLVVAAVGLAGFVVLARPEPSVLRAAVMGSIGLVGVFAGRPTRGIPVLAGAVLVLLVVDPGLAREFGFVLSVLATAALLLLARPWADALTAAGWPRWAAFTVAVPVAAQAVCGPVVVLLTPSVNLLTIPANIAVTAAVAPATVLGLVVTVLALVWPAAAAVLVWIPGLCAQWIAMVARWSAAAPTNVVLPAGWTGVGLLALLTVLLLVLAGVLLRFRGSRRWVGVGLVLVLVAVLFVRCTPRGPSGAWPAADWAVVGCDVGQGDAQVLRTGENSAILVDAGPDDVLIDHCLDRLDVDTLDLVFLTHLHADHVDGLAGALQGRTVGEIWTSPLHPDDATLKGLQDTVAEHGRELGTATAGMSGTTGDVTWTVLAPAADDPLPTDPDSSEVNDSSVVLLAEVHGIRILLTGDLEVPGQRRLLATAATWPGGTDVDVVKVAHHGSARQDRDLYELIRPRVALIEVGAANDYGHPAPETLAILQDTGTRILRTDRDGDVALAGTAENLRTLTRGSDPRDAQRRDRYSKG